MHKVSDVQRWPRVWVRTLSVEAAVAILAGCASTYPLAMALLFPLTPRPALRYLRGHAAGEARPEIVALVGLGKTSEPLWIFTGIDNPS